MANDPLPAVPHSRPWLTEADHRALLDVLTEGQLAEGPRARTLEQRVAERLGLPAGVATSTGSAALLLALRALDVGVGDEVILPTYVCASVWRAVRAAGATPVLCDVGDDWCCSKATVQPVVTPRTKAIVVVHPFGIVADVQAIRELGLPCLEDACQALGAARAEGLAGTLGDACVLSFHATKLLAAGEGGMALSRDPALAAQLRATADEHLRAPLSDLHAALALSQLARYDEFLRRRLQLADRYFEQLTGLRARLPDLVRARSAFFRFPLQVEGQEFDALRAAFLARGVHVRRGVDALLHRQFGVGGEFPQAEHLFRTTVSIPIHPSLSPAEQKRVIGACHDVLR